MTVAALTKAASFTKAETALVPLVASVFPPAVPFIPAGLAAVQIGTTAYQLVRFVQKRRAGR